MQEKTAVLHQLHRAQVDLEGAQGELARANEELAAQRDKVKAFHAAKIAADKRVAEASTANSKTEVQSVLSVSNSSDAFQMFCNGLFPRCY
jgi:predicted  nucleic acid-binding Zn-ribbon protein